MNFYTDIDKYSERIAIITEQGQEITYKEFLSNADNMFYKLKTKSLLFLICKNNAESVCAYIGALRKGIIPVMINSEIELSLYKNLFDTYKPMYVFSPENSLFVKDFALKKISEYKNYTMYKTDFQQDYEINPDLALLLTTSGSTGSPKLVRQSHKNIASNANSIAQYLEIEENDKAITTMPMSYTYCLSIINSHFLKGASIIMNEHSIIQREFWSTFKNLQPTTFGGVPFIYEQLKALRFERMNLPSLKYITQAGGKLSKELNEEFNSICEEKGIKLIVMYGQTEATARMSYLPWKSAKEKVGSIGISIPGGKLSLIDANGNEILEPEVVGELVYQGENVTLGYAEGCYDLNKGDENNGILHTGDMAKKDADGFFYIVGRKKRFLKMYGNRVNLDEVEGILKKEGYNCVCSGQDDKLKVYTTDKNEKIFQEIKKFLSNSLGFTSKSFEVVFIEEIPRNESGKVLYSALRNL